MENAVALDKLITLDFIVDKAVDVFYVSIVATRRFVVKNYDILAKAFNSSFSNNYKANLYRDDFAQELAALKIAATEIVPADEKKFLQWLNKE